MAEGSETTYRAEQSLIRMEDSQQWGAPGTSPGTSLIFDTFIHPREKGVKREIFRFTDDTELFWMAKGCVDGKFQKDLTKLRDTEAGGELWWGGMKVMFQGRSNQSGALAWSSGQVIKLGRRAGSHH